MEILPLLLLALAVSLDSFSVGFTYGLKKVRIPFHAIIIIACCSAIALYFSSVLGQYIGKILSPSISDHIGGGILIILGGWALYQFFHSPKEIESQPIVKKSIENKVVVKFELKSIGIVIQILRKPMSADLDQSGTITGIEALLLGMALSFDAIGAGLGASMLGISPVLLAIMVGIMSAIFAFFGLKFGNTLGSKKWAKQFSFLPGILLIVIGLWKI